MIAARMVEGEAQHRHRPFGLCVGGSTASTLDSGAGLGLFPLAARHGGDADRADVCSPPAR